MPIKKILLLTLCLIFFFTAQSDILAQKLSTEEKAQKRLIVKLKKKQDKEAFAKRVKAKFVTSDEKLDITVLEPETTKEDVIKEIKKDQEVEYIEEDHVAEISSNDSLFSNQWALQKISWSEVNLSSFSSPTTLIAVIDTGVDYNHPDLSSKVDTSRDFDFVNSDSDAMDDHYHGTHVAGVAAAATENSEGIAGVSVNSARILPVKVLDANGAGYYSWIAQGIVYAADQGAKVINLSLGGTSGSRTLENAINYAWNKGAVVVAAAGNKGSTSKHYPAAYSNAIAVWASTNTDTRASFSSYGSWVDVGAPGVNILSTMSGGYSSLNGTSMASPHVAGLAGLIISQNPS